MQKAILYIRKYKQLILVGLLVFGLAPCTVKEAWLSIAGLDYTKPLNGSKTTTSGQQCQYSYISARKMDVQQKIRVNKKLLSNYLPGKTYTTTAAEIRSRDSFYFRANSPPIYILYKRLKLGMVLHGCNTHLR
ncbi:hypothetical protein U0035_05155 [Niabella yanshanensis]|uniref:Uncharacterized protein n=1 Tax=Niabella yanshanensis TaxID=577386 RepID=A0ABZ0W8C5_9BACT|nr:hypothetical protein [Niabella yanshanensis]WQD39533.1 hypothetical protein U0035_05155 [Niabella yanshanensis]